MSMEERLLKLEKLVGELVNRYNQHEHEVCKRDDYGHIKTYNPRSFLVG